MKKLLIIFPIALILCFVIDGWTQKTIEVEALRVLDDFLEAFNARDFEAAAELLHYPHIRIARDDIHIWNTAKEFKAERTTEDIERFVKKTGWHHTAWERRDVIQSSDNKVHIVVRFTRYREDGSVIATYDSFWIVTKRDGRWGVQARSSFAP